MMTPKQKIAASLAPAVAEYLTPDQVTALIEIPKISTVGDYAFPTFTLAKSLHQAPAKIAQELVTQLDASGFEKIEAVGPYVNFFLDKAAFSKTVLSQILSEQAHYGDSQVGQNRNVTLDMSSPNIAKPMSMGHLRSTVIGNAIANILTKQGFHTIKDNHLGDWGTQFGKLITAYKLWGSEEEVKQDPIGKLVGYYVKFHEEDQLHPELDEEAREWFKKLEDGDGEALRLWKWFSEVSLQEFQKVYDLLDVKFDLYKGEAFYNDKMGEVVDLLRDQQLLQESQGAQIVDLSDEQLNPALILKSDGATLYMTRDLACAIYREREYHPALNLYVVGSEQTYHFKQLKAVLGKMGFASAQDLYHIPFGLITVNGKKLSTRSGRIILLEDVLHDAIDLAEKMIEEKNPDLANKDQVAREVGVGAVIFNDLKNERILNIDFNLQDVLRFEGDTGPYVQYTNARAQSLLAKAGNPDLKKCTPSVADPNAWETIKLLAQFPASVATAGKTFEPSVIAKYTLHLAQAFNKYYAKSRILVEDDQRLNRLALVASVSLVLKEALRLLGVKSPDNM